MINTPNEELKRLLQDWEGRKGLEFLFANEQDPNSVSIATKKVGVQPGNIAVMGDKPVTGLIQINRSPLVVLQARFMRHRKLLAYSKPTSQQMKSFCGRGLKTKAP
ncbi:MAG: hypothetical protein ACJAUP_001275 [Cellvibrionaceae bacterium]|jgi:hypothetical protein